MNTLMPDLGKVVYFAIGAFFGGKLLSKIGLKG
jgi:ABC-type branched-subunit amino acid transport system permease subunit